MITGGAHSGKSRFAQELAVKLGEPVLFVATAEAGDEEMKQRIDKHRKERPADWRTLEVTTRIGNGIKQSIGGEQVVIVDCITLLVNNIFSQYGGDNNERIIEEKVIAEINELIRCIEQVEATFIIVTNEVGLGLVPVNKTGRLYRDFLGKANQMLARHASEVYFMVAGLPMRVKPARSL